MIRMKKVGLVLFGFVVSAVAFIPISYLPSLFFKHLDEVSGPIIMMTIVLPFSLFIGSAVIGFLGYYQIE
jgi:hypothetical protein